MKNSLLKSIVLLVLFFIVSCSNEENEEQLDLNKSSVDVENFTVDEKSKELLSLLDEINKTNIITEEQKQLFEELSNESSISVGIVKDSELAQLFQENDLIFTPIGNIDVNIQKISSKNSCDQGSLTVSRRQEEFRGEFTAQANVRWGFTFDNADFNILFTTGVVGFNISPFVAIVNLGSETRYTTTASVTFQDSFGSTSTINYQFIARIFKCTNNGFLNIFG